jgi:hypothetical protein
VYVTLCLVFYLVSIDGVRMSSLLPQLWGLIEVARKQLGDHPGRERDMAPKHGRKRAASSATASAVKKSKAPARQASAGVFGRVDVPVVHIGARVSPP